MSDRRDLVEQWAETERDLRAALAASDAGQEVSNSVAEYLDHNELGLAFETLVESLDQLEGDRPDAVMERLATAYDRMGNPSDGRDAWERLRQRGSS